MSGRITGVLAVTALSVVLLGGCRGPERAALPAPSADPLVGIEATVDAVERAVDADSSADPGQ